MKTSMLSIAAAALIMSAGQTATAQSYVPAPPIAKPNVLPKPVAGRPIKRERKADTAQTDN